MRLDLFSRFFTQGDDARPILLCTCCHLLPPVAPEFLHVPSVQALREPKLLLKPRAVGHVTLGITWLPVP